MCEAVHPGMGDECNRLDMHTGLHESADGLLWGCEGAEHDYYAYEGQQWPATHCLVCGLPYAYRDKPAVRGHRPMPTRWWER